MSRTPLSPAHVGWRFVQTVADDFLVTLVVVMLAAAVGQLPDAVEVRELLRHDGSALESARGLLRLVPAVSVLYALYWMLRLVYQMGFLRLCNGQTPMCRLMRLRVVMDDGSPVTWRAALERTVAGGLLGQVPFVGQVLRFVDYLITLFNRRRQALRDIAAGTMLVYAAGPDALGSNHG